MGSEVSFRTRHGIELSGVVVFNSYESQLVDLSVIEIRNEAQFTDFIRVHSDPISHLDEIAVMGFKVGVADETLPVYYTAEVNAIENTVGSAMFQATYASFAGLSGAGVVTKIRNGECKVVGIHVASHDDSTKNPKKRKPTVKSVNLACESLASDLHGHHAFCLICEAARVPDLMTFLRDKNAL